ncbi:class I SAM-dependent methyltransferase [Geminicoccus flavidas]|uniref:class I SAM-dependent methyltransferase n=1 Tax=Geminicoccus flavidas TaxID=2506407 RepID=UPI0013580F0F|nr:rRNA adenine N-6-methyltransferase family protein [Geminicoccus flavidas]
MQRIELFKESELFFKTWLRSPKSMGSIIPSSQSLAKKIAEQVVWQPGEKVVELGGGTGAITQGLVDSGIPREALIVVELDEKLHKYLSTRFMGATVVRGDATKLDQILSKHGVRKVSTIISGLPMVGMPDGFREAIYKGGMKIVGPKGVMLQYSYSPISPIPHRRYGLNAKLAGFVLNNMPPAYVWKYTSAADRGA